MLRASVAAVATLALVAALLPTVAGAAEASHAISGTVKNVSGAAVSGVQIGACYTGSDGYSDVCEDATTAADGTFTIAGLAPREYVLELTDPAGKYPSGWYADGGFTVDSGAAAKVTVADADVTGILVAYPAIFRMSGRVEFATGAPAKDAGVWPCLKDKAGQCDLKAVTGADGTFSMPVVGGDYTIFLTDETLAMDNVVMRFFPQRYRVNGAATGDPQVFSVTADVGGLDLRLQPVSTISGQAVTARGEGSSIVGCPTDPTTGTCHGLASLPGSWSFLIAVVPTKIVVRVSGYGATLPGFWTPGGLVATQERATVLDLTSRNESGMVVTGLALGVGIHTGASVKGSFGVKPVAVGRGMAVTLKVTSGAGYAGRPIQIQAATLDRKGKPGTFKTVATKVLGVDGSFAFTAKPAKSTAWRVRYVPPQDWVDRGVAEVLSASVVAKVR